MAIAMVPLQESAPLDVNEVDEGDERNEDQLRPGTKVEVKRRFDAKWSRGFEVLEQSSGLYRLRRLSDGTTLPVLFPADDVRPERRNTTWWI
jgi:hypothetical protein